MVFDDDNNNNNNNNKIFTANVTLIPCTLALLKNSNVKPLVLETFLLAPLLFFPHQHTASGSPDSQGSKS